MARRLYRELTNFTKSKISNSLKNFHRNQNVEDKRQTNKKKSISMQRYWNQIGHKPTGITSDTTIEDIML
jgi:ribosomal protein S2